MARTEPRTERTCGDNEPYEGTSGVEMSSFARRAAFALAFLDYNLVGSGAINDDSQMLWVRIVEDRVKKLAPFLHYDGDPYPVVVDGGVQWVIDAYTSTAATRTRSGSATASSSRRRAASRATPTTSATA